MYRENELMDFVYLSDDDVRSGERLSPEHFREAKGI